ncbi:MAG: lamin tail domain-containing protein, partial [Phycisphaerae bacterium]|nr:lamin tail domain-containing protein [Phycisphaerae bacterium]
MPTEQQVSSQCEGAVLEALEQRVLLSGVPMISEFMASNDTTLVDGDGKSSDWIELHNPSAVEVDLAGWFLTDDIADLIQWEFPDDPGIDTTLDPGEYRIIFASAEDDVYPYVDPAGYLHTNFKLSTNDGSQHESVLLVRDDTTTIEHGYIDYPQQYTDVSYGVVWDSTAVTTLASGAAAKVVVPDATYSGVGTAWTSLTGYDDSSWSDGTAGIGFDITPAPSFDPLIAYDIEGAMEGVNTSAYVRIPFTYASSTDDLLRLALEMQYDDGFVAYLNGVKVAESNAPGSPEYDSSATDDRLDDSALEFESFTIDNASTILQTGANMLAIHGMSASIGDGDFLAVPSLVAVTGDIVTPEELSYFAAGTPFEANVSEAGSDPDKRIIINELHVNPDVKTEPVEFIELYNNTDELIDLSGWYFSNGVTFTFAPGTVIGPYGYLVIAENVAAVTSKFAIAGVLGPYVGSLDNDGEKVTLRDSLGAKQDEVDYGLGFPWPTTGDAPGYSLELISPELDNDLGGSWRASLGSAGSQGVFFETFEEWKYFKGVAEPTATVGQWHEGEGFDDSLWLTGDGALGYSNMVGETQYINTTLDDMDGGYSTVYFRKEFNVANPGVVASLELQTRADDGIVVWINDTLMFSVNVDDSDPAYPDLPYDATASAAIDGVNLIPHTLPDPSTFLVAGTNVIAVQLLNASIGSSSDAFWDARLVSGSGADAGATAGMLNSVYSSNAAPQMRQVAHGPNQPVSGQDVTVTVKATDPEGVAQVTMDYQVVNPGDYISISDSRYGNASFWTTVDMYDDGTNGDAVAGDDVYSAIIPAAVQTNRKLVRYRVTAVDTLGASVTGPYDDDPQQNFAYYVYDGVPDWTGSARPGVESDVVYSSQTLTSVPVYTLITRRLDRLNALHVPYRSGEADQELPTSGTYGGSDYKWEGTLIYDGVVYDNIRYRARGGVWRYSMGKNMWKFDFNRGHSFQARDDYGNLYDTTWDKLNFSAIIQQGNFGQRGEQGLFEAAGFALHNLAGNESPNTNFIHFRVVEDADESGPDQFSSDFQGLYLVLEQPDGRMLDEHDMPDGNFYKMEGGTGTLNNQGPTQPTDKSDLNTFMGGYQSSPTQAWFEANLDLDNYYNFRAMAMATHDYDIHAGKNYFYYHNPETDLWSVQNWDLDLTWTTSYGGGGGRGPLNDYVFAHPQFVIDYNNRLRELRDLLFNVEQTGMLLDEFAQFVYTAGQPSLVDADAAMWDYNPIMVSSYVNSSKSGWGRFYGNSPTDDFAGMIQIMKDYVAGKTNNVDPRVSSDDGQAPNTPGVWYTGPAGYPIDSLTFQTTGFSGGSGGFAAMEWRIAAVTDTSSPGFDPSQPRKYEITPSWESGEITSYSSSIAIPGYDLKAGETYRVRVRMKDSAGRWSHWSAPAQLVAGDADPYILDHLRITELNYSPHEPTPDEITAGHVNAYDFEFIELQNTGSEMMDLSGISFVDGITFDFAGSAVTSLTAGERVVIVRNEAAFAYRYSAGLNVAGSYQGFLSNGGELVMATDAYSRAVVNFTFNDAGGWSGRADGKGATLEIIDTAGDYNDSENWRASVLYGGTPDAAGEPPVGVVINEVLSHTDVPDVDSIELYNTTGGTIDIGGWFISDSWGWSWSPATGDYKKYQIAPNTLIGSGQYLVFDESDFNSSGGVDPLDFALSAGHGDDVWLMKTDGAGNLTHFADHVDFGAAANGESFGRWPNAVGDLYPMTLVTLDGVNSGPRVGPLIISEVMYNAPDPDGLGGVDPDDLEFIELYNPTGSVINLAAWEDNIHTAGQYYADWRFRGGVSMSFDAGSTVAAGGILVVLSFDPNKPENASRVAAFRDHYGIDVSVPLAGGYSGKLNDDGERIELQRPDSPSLLEPDFVPHLLEDQVRYDDVAPWAVSPDGLGDSLQRTPVTGWGDDSANWIAATPDPGAYAVINNAPVVVNPITDVTVDEDASDTVVDLSTTFDDPDLGDTLTLSVSGNTNVGMVTTSVLGANLTLSYIADQNGTADITIRATDPLGAWVEDTFAVTVNPINDAPPTVVSPISDVTVDEDASDTVIDLESVFDDIDVGDTLVYSITSNTNISLVTTNIVGSDLTLSYAADQNGSSEITVRATDQNGAGSWVEDTFTVTVDPVNDAPTLASPLAEVTVDEDAPDTVIDLSSVFDDIDLGDALTFQVTVNTNISLVATDV